MPKGVYVKYGSIAFTILSGTTGGLALEENKLLDLGIAIVVLLYQHCDNHRKGHTPCSKP